MAASENKAVCEQNSRQIAQPVLQGTSAVKIYQGSLVDIKTAVLRLLRHPALSLVVLLWNMPKWKPAARKPFPTCA